jgi:hypothetical protein
VKLAKRDESTVFGVLRLANMWIFPEVIFPLQALMFWVINQQKKQVRNQALAIVSGFPLFEYPSNDQDFTEMIRLGEEYYVQQWVLAGYSQIVRKRGLNFGDLEKDPYHFNQTLVNKILYLKVIYGPGREHECTGRCGWDCDGYRPDESDLQTVLKELLRDELARALYVTDDHGSLN